MSLQIPSAASKPISEGPLAGHPAPEGMSTHLIAAHEGTAGSTLHGPDIPGSAISGSTTNGPPTTGLALTGSSVISPGPVASPAAVHGPASVAGLDPYEQLNQATPAVALHSTANRFAVGVHDPSLGYLEIDAQSAAGQISAALVTNSSLSHASLAAQLPSLHQYLGDQQVRLSHLGVEQQMPQGDRSAPQREGGQSSGGSASESPPAPSNSSANLSRVSQRDLSEFGETGMLSSYINVRV